MKYKVLITDGLGKKGIEKLKSLNDIELIDKTGIDKSELLLLIPEIDILLIRSRTKVDRELIDHAIKLKLICRAGIGIDNVDIEYATTKGIIVMNSPQGNIVTTAEHTIALLMALTRNIPQADSSIRQFKWEKKNLEGHEVRGKTLGIIGLGNIGRVVSEIARGIGMSVIGYDPFITDEVAKKHNVILVEWETLLKTSNYISVHVPKNETTLKLIDKKALSLVTPGSYLINCSRGGIVDEKAVIEALELGIIKGYAADVFEIEPIEKDHPFLKHPRVIMTPHIGASTIEAQEQVGIESANQIIEYVTTGMLKNTINIQSLTSTELSIYKPYLTFCERFGLFCSKLHKNREIKKISVYYQGLFPFDKFELPTSALVKGVLTPICSSPPNIVNSINILKNKGVSLEIRTQSDSNDFIGTVSITIFEDNNELFLSGALFGRDNYRLLRINNFEFDTYLGGNLLIIENVDKPGMVGAIGKFLADYNINIATMSLSRDSSGGNAMGIITIDSSLGPQKTNELKNIKGITSIKEIIL